MPKKQSPTARAVRKIKVQLVKSPIGYAQRQKDTVRSLGLSRLSQVIEQSDTPQIRGMIAHVSHLVRVLEAGDKP